MSGATDAGESAPDSRSRWRTRRRWLIRGTVILVVLFLIAACDSILGPQFLLTLKEPIRYHRIRSVLRVGEPRKELYARLQRIGELPYDTDNFKPYPYPRPKRPHPEVFMTFEKAAGLCWYEGYDLTISFDDHEKVSQWVTKDTHDAC